MQVIAVSGLGSMIKETNTNIITHQPFKELARHFLLANIYQFICIHLLAIIIVLNWIIASKGMHIMLAC